MTMHPDADMTPPCGHQKIVGVGSFASQRLDSACGGLPVEVVLLSRLSSGAGSALIADVSARQRRQPGFIDALDEPSVRLSGMTLAQGDPSSLYSFVVGAQGHPFHRHAGRRMFTAVSGSGGARLRFSTASDAQIDADPWHFIRALRHVDIPPDCLFSVRFGGAVWHQFTPRDARQGDPALMAVSCHPDELDGPLSAHAKQQVLNNAADIATLTETLPEPVRQCLESPAFDADAVPCTCLDLDAPLPIPSRADEIAPRQPAGERYAQSLLDTHLPTPRYQDVVSVETDAVACGDAGADDWLAWVLDGFLSNSPAAVSRLMRWRNALVAPLRLRTSPLGCPVSSLLAPHSEHWFAGRFPVLDSHVDAVARHASVVLGADDRHLRFRSCVTVTLLADHRVRFSLATRVQTRNAFGRFYMAAIDAVHRHYIAPALLRHAVAHAMARARGKGAVAAESSVACVSMTPGMRWTARPLV